LCVAIASGTPAAAQSLVCFGNEPSWSVTFTAPGRARFDTPEGPPSDYEGKETRNAPLGERLWRGRSAAGGDLVVFLRDAPCSDGMSDTTHPVTARVSTPDGRFLAGCCRIAAPPPASAALEGTTWRLAALPGHAPDSLARLEPPVTARFEGGRVTGFAGCNTFTGPYTSKDDRLTIGLLAGTMMACPEPAMTLERAVHGAFKGTFSVAIAGDRLRLTGESGGALEFAKEPDPTPEGGTWDVTGYNNGRHAVVGPHADTRLTVVFANGALTGDAGCNTFRATYSIRQDRISIGPAATTRKMCAEDVMTQEREFLKAIESATTWSIDTRGLLHLHRPDGERVLVAGPRRR
jgi:heat shock protein HslJ